MKLNAIALAMSTAALFGADAHAQTLNSAAGTSGVLPSAVEGVAVLLYDQTDSAGGNGAPDQNFEAAFDQYDSEGADDFVVPGGTAWSVSEIRTVGTQSTGGSAVSVNVNFYADNAGFPDATAVAGCSYPALIPAETAGSYVLTLPTACVLPPGTYWVAIQSNQDFGGGNGQHFWSNRSVASNSGAVWRNPGNGFGTGCVNWDRMTTCGVGGGTNPDFLFQVFGTEVSLDADVSVTKTAAAPAELQIGSTITYTLTATNAGPGTADNVVVTDTLPSTLTYVSNTCGAVAAGQQVTWTIGTLAPGSAACDLVTTVRNVGPISNTATIATTSNDPTPANNSSTASLLGVARQVPTLGQLGLVLLGLLVAGAAVLGIRR